MLEETKSSTNKIKIKIKEETISLPASRLADKQTNKKMDESDCFDFSSKDGGVSQFIPSIVVYNTSRFKYLENSVFVLNDNQFTNSSWKFIEESKEVEWAGPAKNEKKQNSDKACPFGKLCSEVHNPCQIFQPEPRRKSRRSNRKEQLKIYSCNVRSINNKK